MTSLYTCMTSRTVVMYVTICAILLTYGRTEGQETEETESLVQTRAGPEIYSLHVETDIAYRFATTKVISRLANKAKEAKEAVFAMTIPKTAFISSFVMTIDGVDYPGEVKEKVKAKREYEAAKKKGESAGRVSAVQARDTFQFRVAVNVAAQSKVDFNLTYQELLERRLGFYEYVLNINPGHVVRDLRVDVYIRESSEITEVRVPPLKTSVTDVLDTSQMHPDVSVMRDGRSAYHILYDPDEALQQLSSDTGVSGQLVVQYDVIRDTDAGEIQVIDGYFVHYFAPSGLEPVNKNVLFIIDISGSMAGSKMQQTKDAMYTILDDLREGDMFNIITFSSSVFPWAESVMEVSPDNIRRAKEFVKDINADGGTNINDALLRGVDFLEDEWVKEWEKKPSMIIFLTDGDPTSGITSPSRILANIRKANRDRYTVFSLGFGANMDFNFMQKISLQNNGLARRIYADSDAALQLEGFYNEVSTPVLSDIEISYVGDVVEDDYVTDVKFPAFYRGSEIVIAGKLKEGTKNLDSRVQGHASGGFMQFDANVRIPKVEKEALQTAYSNFTEKLWAFLTIRKLLDKMLQSDNATEREAAKAKALELSLKYSFVTPLTSMVVTKPDQPNTNFGDLEDEEEEKTAHRPSTSPKKNPGGRQHMHYSSAPSNTKRKTSFVDNDPHFIVHVRGMTDAVCFNIDGPPGDIYQLIHDRVSGTVVNGLVVGKRNIPEGHKYPRTYIGELMFLYNGVSLHVTPTGLVYTNSGNTTSLPWKHTVQFTDSGVNIFIEARTKVFIRLGDNIVLAVLRHMVNPGHKSKVNFLGLYVVDQDGLSEHSHGLIGQFLHQSANMKNNRTSGSSTLTDLHLHGPNMSHKNVTAKRIQRRDMDRKDYVTCWNVRNNGRHLLAGSYKDYLVPSLRHAKHVILSKTNYKTARKLHNLQNRSWLRNI